MDENRYSVSFPYLLSVQWCCLIGGFHSDSIYPVTGEVGEDPVITHSSLADYLAATVKDRGIGRIPAPSNPQTRALTAWTERCSSTSALHIQSHYIASVSERLNLHLTSYTLSWAGEFHWAKKRSRRCRLKLRQMYL